MSSGKVKVEDLRRFVFVSDPRISPDGSQAAFVHTKIDYAEDRYDKHIWMWARDCGRVRQFTHGLGSDNYPCWSPDGRQLLFLSRGRETEKKTQLWVIPAKGGEASMAVDVEEGVSSPAWAPDSKRMLFLSRTWMEEKPKSDVKVVKRIRYRRNDVGTFEGRRVHLYTARPGLKPKRVTDGDYDVWAAKWSPDGRYIGFVANMEEGADLSRVRDIYVAPVKGGEPRRLTQGGHFIADLSWSPAGDQISFIGDSRPGEFAVNLDLWVMLADGGEMRNLTIGFDRSLGMGVGSDLRVATPRPGPVWSADGGSIYFLTASTPHSNVYKIGIDGGSPEVVTRGKTVDGFSLSADDAEMAYTAMSAIRPTEL